MKKTFLYIIFFIVFINLEAQNETNLINFDLKDYDFGETPRLNQIADSFKNEPAIIIFNKLYYEHKKRLISNNNKGIVIKHVAIKILNASAIQEFNKINTDDGWVKRVLNLKARIIKPNGDIINIPKKDIIKSEVENTKYLIINGVEVGDIIEYFYVLSNFFDKSDYFVYKEKAPTLELKIYFLKNNFELIHISSPVYPFTFDTIVFIDYYGQSNNDNKIITFKNLPAFNTLKFTNNFYNLIKIYYQIEDWATYYYAYGIITKRNLKTKKDFYKNKPTDIKRVVIDQLNDSLDNFLTYNNDTNLIINYLIQLINNNFELKKANEEINRIKNIENKAKISALQFVQLFDYFFYKLELKYCKIECMSNKIDKLYINDERILVSQPTSLIYYIQNTKKYFSPFNNFLYGYLSSDLQNTMGYYSCNDIKFTYLDKIKDSNQLINELIIDTLEINLTQQSSLKRKYTTFHNLAFNIRESLKELGDFSEKETADKIKKLYLFNDLKFQTSDFEIENNNQELLCKDTPLVIKGNALLTKDFLVDIDENNFSFNLKNFNDEFYDLQNTKPRAIDYNFKTPAIKTQIIYIKLPDNVSIANLNEFNINKSLEINNKLCGIFKTNYTVLNKNLIEIKIYFELIEFIYPQQVQSNLFEFLNSVDNFYLKNMYISNLNNNK